MLFSINADTVLVGKKWIQRKSFFNEMFCTKCYVWKIPERHQINASSLINVSDHTKVKYIVNCPKMPDYTRTELEKLRVMLATLLHAHYDDILVSGVKNGCVIVTFMLRNCLVPTLKTLYTSEKISMTCQWMLKLSLKYKVMKVMIKEEVIYMSGMFLYNTYTSSTKLNNDIST